ncbi:hypothetical protein GGH90_08960, partial [Streptococcus sp. zg-36]
MKQKRKKKYVHQMKRNKALKTVVAASAIGVVGTAVIDSRTVAADTTETVSSVVRSSVENQGAVEEASAVAEETLPVSDDETRTAEEIVADLSAEARQEVASLKEIEEKHVEVANAEEIQASTVATPVVSEAVTQPETENKVAERVAGITYKVTYTDVETDKVVQSENKSLAVRTSDKPATVEVTETAVALNGYRLAEDQSETISAVVTENRRNILNFNVLADKESVVAPAEGASFRAHLMTPTNDKPYITIERYWGNNRFENVDYAVTKNGDTLNISYKMGTTRISPDDVELTDGAKKLGLTYDKVSNYITGTVKLDASVEIGTYEIGLVSKTDPAVKASADLKIQSHKGFVPRAAYAVLSESFQKAETRRQPVKFERGHDYFVNEVTSGEFGRAEFSETENKPSTNLTYGKLLVPVTPFGYYIENDTVASATPKTKQYDALFQLEALDSLSTFPENHLSIARFEQTGGSDKVKIAFKDLSKTNPGTKYSPHSGIKNYTIMENGRTVTKEERYSSDVATPYIVQFTELPELAGDYFVTFKVVDNLGLEKNFRLDFKTYERSQDGALTNADVRFVGTSEYLAEGATRVSVPTSTERQVLGKVIKNKENATIKPVSFPDGTELTETGEVVKKDGAKLTPGIYKFEVKAVDGHFGDNAPTRIFEFEVTDVINPIAHQVWKEGEVFPAIPVSLEGGSTITDMKVEASDNYAIINKNIDKSSLEGSGIQTVKEHQTAKVIVSYQNRDGSTSVTSTIFTYEVQPNPDNDLDLDVTNAKQTVKEGEHFEDMVITHTQGATLTVDTSKLPIGVSYNSETKTISGIGRYEGVYRIPVTVSLDKKTKTKFVELTVTPGQFTVEPIELTIPVLEKFEYKIPRAEDVNLEVSQASGIGIGNLPSGLTFDEKTGVISGTPTVVGEFSLGIYGPEEEWEDGLRYSRDRNGGKQYATGDFKITVTPKDLEISGEDRTVMIGDAIDPIILSVTDGARIDRVDKLPSGLIYNSETKTISGTPTQKGESTVTVRASYPEIRGNEKTTTLKINVLPRPIEVTAEDRTVQILDEMTPIVFKVSDKAEVSFDESTLPEGLTYDRTTRTISGRPTRKGDFELSVTAAYPFDRSDSRTTTKFKITVTPKPLDISAEDRTVQVLDMMTPIKITVSEGAKIRGDVISYLLPEGLVYDPDTQTISGTPTIVTSEDGNTITVSAYYPGAESDTEVTKKIVIKVTPLPVTVEANPKTQTVDLGTAMQDIVVTSSEHSKVSLWTPYSVVPEENIDAAVFSEYGLHYDPKTKTLSGTPSKIGNFNLVFQASNPFELGSAEAKTTVSLSVVEDSLDLTLSHPIQTVLKGSSIRNAVIKHTEGATLKVDTSMLPEGVTYNEATKTFSGKPGVSGTFEIPVTLTNARGTKTKSTLFDLTVLELPEYKNATQSSDPSINKVIEGDTTISGSGQAGAIIEVRLPNGEIKEVTVAPNGIWMLENLPAFEKGQSVTVKQTESGKTASDAINTTAVPVITQGDNGKDGTPGRDGVDGKDGQSPTITTKRGDKDGKQGTIVTITNATGDSVETFIPDGEKGDKGDQGEAGAAGAAGRDGQDGTPGRDGVDGKDGTPGRDGVDGKDGQSPTITTKRGDKDGKQGTIVTITNATGDSVETFIPDGEKGDKGDQGEAGAAGRDGQDGTPGRDGVDGKDGQSPTITTKRGDKDGKQGTIVTITNATGDSVETFIPDGEKGDKGDQGEAGAAGRDGVDGKDGQSPTITTKRGDKDGKQGTIVTITNATGDSVET